MVAVLESVAAKYGLDLAEVQASAAQAPTATHIQNINCHSHSDIAEVQGFLRGEGLLPPTDGGAD